MKLIRSRTGGQTLELKVAGPAAALIQHQAPEILARVNMLLGAGEVTRLRIVQGVLRQKDAPAPRRRARGPLDAAAEQDLARGLEAQPDGALKAALLKLGREVLRGER